MGCIGRVARGVFLCASPAAARGPSAEWNGFSLFAFPAMNRWAFFFRPAERDFILVSTVSTPHLPTAGKYGPRDMWATSPEGAGRGARLLLRASLIVRGLDAGSATRSLGYAFSILRLGFSTFGGLSGGHSIRIGMCDSSIAGARVDGSGAVGPLSCTNSIVGVGCATFAGRGGCYAVRILLGDGSIARVRVDCNCSFPIATNGLTTAILDALSREQAGSEKEARYQQNILHLYLR